MTKRLRISLLLLGCLMVLALLAVLMLYMAVCHEPDYYRRAMEIPKETLEEGSKEMIRQAGALQSVAEKDGAWETLITAKEINGWLAVDLKHNHPNALPEMIRDPRVAIDQDGITIACRYEKYGVTSVLNLTLFPSVSESNVVKLRIVSARAGLLPVPLKPIVDSISEAARGMRFRLEWRGSGGEPVALLSLPGAGEDEPGVIIETIQLGEGEIFISGRTKRRKP